VRRWLFVLPSAALAAFAFATSAFAQEQSEREHVPPDPPQTRVHSMPYGEMAEMMGMDDRKRFGKVMLDELEWEHGDSASTFEWDAAAWYGGDFNKLRIETEGQRSAGETQELRAELLWDRIVTPWWSLRAGMRHDAGVGPARDWAAFGIAGLSPVLVEVEAAVYLGEGGRGAARLSTHHDLLLTQRLILQTKAELDAYTRADEARLIGKGISGLTLGLRLRYEFRREFAPYFGVNWSSHFGDSADLRQAAGESRRESSLVVGVRAWF
jgi:copper resistance protein B